MNNECKKNTNARLARFEKLESYIPSEYNFDEIFEWSMIKFEEQPERFFNSQSRNCFV